MKPLFQFRSVSSYASIVLILFLLGCGGDRNAGPIKVMKLSMEERLELFQAVNYCRGALSHLTPTRIQVLMDASGSMTGYKNSAIQLSRWVKSSVSALEGSAIERKSFQLAHFNKGQGIFKKTGWGGSEPALIAQYDTNLDDAIISAKQFDLTFIITDGVAATGSSPSNRCAGGVDAACIARVFAEVRQTMGGENEGIQGIWLLPVVATYNGVYYTEEPQGDFDSKETIASVKSDVAVNVQLTAPKIDKHGNLTFSYDGPRALLLIVLSRNVIIGREAVAALYETATSTGVNLIKDFKSHRSGVSIFEPIEIYPGNINPISWQSLKVKDMKGNFSAKLTSKGTHARIQFSGDPGKSNSGTFSLQGTPSARTTGAGCVPMHILPSFRVSFQVSDGKKQTDFVKIFLGFAKKGNELSNIDIRMVTDESAKSATALETQFVALVDYKETADAIAGKKDNRSGVKLVNALSTLHPRSEPHKIYNFSTIFQMFFMEVQQDQKKSTISSIDFFQE